MKTLREKYPQLDTIFEELSQARSFLDVAYAVLTDDNENDALVVMRHGLDLLEKAHDALDTAAEPKGENHDRTN